MWGGLRDGCPPPHGWAVACQHQGCPCPVPCGHGSQKTLPGWERAGSPRGGQSSPTAGLRHPGGTASVALPLLTPTPRDTTPGGTEQALFKTNNTSRAPMSWGGCLCLQGCDLCPTNSSYSAEAAAAQGLPSIAPVSAVPSPGHRELLRVPLRVPQRVRGGGWAVESSWGFRQCM